jgi:thioredoxin 1
MATVNITKDTISETIENHDIVLIDFWAEWCGPCRSFAPTYEKVSEAFADRDLSIAFAKVDTEAEQELAASFGIRSIPTLVAFRDNIGVFSQPGALPEDALEDLIGQIEGLDMDAIREEIASGDHASHEEASEESTTVS